MAKIAEYFTLRDASTTAARIPDAGRKEIAGALAVGRQQAEAAEALWSNGHAAEGLRLAASALTTTIAAAPSYARVVSTTAKPAPSTSVPAPTVKNEPDDGEAAALADAAAASDDAAAASADAAATSGAAASDADDAAADAERATEAGVAESAAANAVLTSSVSQPAGDEPGARSWREVLAARGVSPEKLAMIADAEQKARTAPLPRLDSELSSAHTDLYQTLARARLEVDRALAYSAMSPGELRWTRIARIATVSVLAVLVAGGLWLAMRTPIAVTAEASDTFAQSPQFGPPNVLDGQIDTEWLLPDRATGWVEARLSPARHVSRVTLVNAKNAPHFDRATRAYRLELYSSGRMVRGIDGEFAAIDRDPEPVTHDLDLDDIDRVRFVVRSSHNLGGGLAELTIEE